MHKKGRFFLKILFEEINHALERGYYTHRLTPLPTRGRGFWSQLHILAKKYSEFNGMERSVYQLKNGPALGSQEENWKEPPLWIVSQRRKQRLHQN